MTGSIALAASVAAAMFAWCASPASTWASAGRRRARWLAAVSVLAAAAAWTHALGLVPGLCAACASIGAGCSVMPFAVEATRRLRQRIGEGHACRIAS